MKKMDSAKQRAKELVAKMTTEERASQLRYDAPAIPRLDIPAYNWWNEGLHGVARAGVATVFPQAIGLAAAFDPELVYRAADIISTEARAKYNAAAAENDPQHQHLPRSALGTRARDLWRGSLSDRPAGRGLRQGSSG